MFFLLLFGSGYLLGNCYPRGDGYGRKLHPRAGLGFGTCKIFFVMGMGLESQNPVGAHSLPSLIPIYLLMAREFFQLVLLFSAFSSCTFCFLFYLIKSQ
jgi:hypothetical protein